MKSKGIIVKIKGSKCIVVTREGTYHKIPLPPNGVRVGQEIEFSQAARPNWLKYALMAASVLILAVSLSLYQPGADVPVYAYISLDINPSVELAVDKNLQVLEVHLLNADAEEYYGDLDLKGADLFSSFSAIMDRSVQKGLIFKDRQDYILSAVTLAEAGTETTKSELDPARYADELEKAVAEKGLGVNIVVLAADPSLREEAKNRGLSTGKLAVYQTESAAGGTLTINQIKEKSLTELVQDGKVKLLPNGKTVVVKKAHAGASAGEVKPAENTEPKENGQEKTEPPKSSHEENAEESNGESNGKAMGKPEGEAQLSTEHSNSAPGQIKKEQRIQEEDQAKQIPPSIEEKGAASEGAVKSLTPPGQGKDKHENENNDDEGSGNSKRKDK